MPKYKIAIGMSSINHQIHWGVLASFIEMINAGVSGYDLRLIVKKGIYIDKLRNDIAIMFLKSDADFLLYLDYDNGLHPDSFDLFMEDFEDENVNIVSGSYFLKEGNLESQVAGCMFKPDKRGWYDFMPRYAVLDDLVNLSKMNGSYGGATGTGCLMIRRKVLEKMTFPYFATEWYLDGCNNKHFMGEDIWFCEQAEKYGFDIHLDQRIKSPHYFGAKCTPGEWKQIS